MGFRLKRGESVVDGVKRIAREQLEKAVAEIQSTELDRHEAVHQVRKRFKKIRGIIRLVRPGFEKTYQRENALFRDAGREISAVRDAQSLIEACDRLVPAAADSDHPPKFAGIRVHLVERRQRIAGDLTDLPGKLDQLAQDIQEAEDRVKDWKLDDGGFEAIAGGFEKTYRRAQKAMKNASRKKAAMEDFHEWRKRVKYHWYHCRLLVNLYKPLMKARCEEAKHLADLLGDDHDLSMLDLLLAEHATDFPDLAEVDAFREVLRKSQKTIRAEAFDVGERLFAEKSKHLTRRFEAWWSTWRDAA